MNEKKKVLLAMSGGVDSSVAAVVLQRMGYEVIGATMRLWEDPEISERTDGCCSLSSVNDAKWVCYKLGIEHYVFNYLDEFEDKVINNFLEEYKSGRTPNPCIMCNKHLKFGKFLHRAKELGIEYIATGHYAKVVYDESIGRYLLKKSKADKKDQTYVLYNMTQDMLKHTIFPLGDFEDKEEVRKIAEEIGLVTAKKPDSQEICFIPDNDYAKFISSKFGEQKPGNIVDVHGKVLGKHNGIINYTIGQRKGLGISNKEPLFVIKIDKDKNEVIVGTEEGIFGNELVADDMNFIAFESLKEPLLCKAKIRYSAKEADCTVYPLEKNKAKIVFKDPQRAITPGQAVVLYKEDNIIGGGIIV
jgi:tRNA-specific 2-thiouridylase